MVESTSRQKRLPRSTYAPSIQLLDDQENRRVRYLLPAMAHPMTVRPETSRAFISAPAKSALDTAASSAVVAASSNRNDTGSMVRPV